MTKTANDIIQIVRNATGRNDKTDPMFTDQVILGYINDFYTLEMGQELRLKEKRTWWEFDYGPDVANYSNPLPVNLEAPFGAPSTPQQVQYTTIGPLCYADGFKVFWYEDPKTFYAIWPETQPYQPQRPTYVLYYNNELTFRGPPDRTYRIKIDAYQVEFPLQKGESNIDSDYLWRYIAYGAALDILNDYREFEVAAQLMSKFLDYKAKVYARTYQQQQNQRSIPSF